MQPETEPAAEAQPAGEAGGEAPADLDGGRSFNFAPFEGDAFEGSRVLDMKRRERRREERRATPATVAANLLAQGPGTVVLVILFALLTVGDFVFNFSRAFICVLPDLCDPVDAGAVGGMSSSVR